MNETSKSGAGRNKKANPFDHTEGLGDGDLFQDGDDGHQGQAGAQLPHDLTECYRLQSLN